MNLQSFLDGGIEFLEDEEYLAFRYRLLNAAMLTATVFAGLFVLIDWAGINHLGRWQLLATQVYFLLCLLLMAGLRGRKGLFQLIGGGFIGGSFLTFVSALLFVANDELRIIWFYLVVVLAFNLLGHRAGVLLTLLSMGGILVANFFMPLPFSRNALTTALVSFAVTAVVSYAYTSRAISYFERMTASNRQLRELASKDFLTGLLNARAYYEVANGLIRLARRNGKPFAVLFIDLDHFKLINDRHGHEKGDEVLRAVAACLAHEVRSSDLLGRIGGEEFSCFLPETELAGAQSLAEKLRLAVAALVIGLPDGARVPVSASIGVARNQAADDSMMSIQKRADRAMYLAKSQGRNRTVCIEDGAVKVAS